MLWSGMVWWRTAKVGNSSDSMHGIEQGHMAPSTSDWGSSGNVLVDFFWVRDNKTMTIVNPRTLIDSLCTASSFVSWSTIHHHRRDCAGHGVVSKNIKVVGY